MVAPSPEMCTVLVRDRVYYRVDGMSQDEISDYCQEETGYAIGSNDVGPHAAANSIHNVQECRTYCTSINGATHFTFTPQSGQSWGNCVCKSSQSPLNAMNGAISGKVICTATTSTTTTTTASPTTTITTSVSPITTSSNCLVEENSSYDGTDINNGLNDPTQNDANSCRTYCDSTYPNALYFNWIPLSDVWTAARETCWCKSSKTGKVSKPGRFAGEICRSSSTTTTSTTTSIGTSSTSATGWSLIYSVGFILRKA